MSYNIFYTQVDSNLQEELNARGRAGVYDRSNKSLDYMLSKVANIKLTAYNSTGSNSEVVDELGGETVRGSRYQPNTFLSDPSYTVDSVNIYEADTPAGQAAMAINALNGNNVEIGKAYLEQRTLQDKSRRVGPYISNVLVNIGDHSFGLLNKADINIVIPNVERDLDRIETNFFRPGRYVRIDITHPETAVITRDSNTAGLLLPNILPNEEKLKTLYPGMLDTQIQKLKDDARRINSFRFEGLITTFNFSYDRDGTVNASLKLTGTSNVYTDVSMFQNADATKEKEKKSNIADPSNTETLEAQSAETGSNYTSQFYESLYDVVDQNIASDILQRAAEDDIIPKSDVTDAEGKEVEYILNLDVNINEKLPNRVLTKLNLNEPHYNPADTNDQWVLKGEPYVWVPDLRLNNIIPSVRDYRYITLGALIEFINGRILSKAGGESSAALPLIMCNELVTTSNYYGSLVSADPESILLLPQRPGEKQGMNTYGGLRFYQNIISSATGEWPGIWEEFIDKNNEPTKIIYPSRIFINLSLINKIVTKLSNEGRTSYNVKSFLAEISAYIKMNTGGAIEMKLVTHPTLQDALLFADVKCIKPTPTPSGSNPVIPYSVPMFANHEHGTICRDFKFNATLPESAKNLAYVLNSSSEIAENDIAPFINFMYTAGSGDVGKINAFIEKYEKKYTDNLEALESAKSNFGNEPYDDEPKTQLRKALNEYIKYPYAKIQDSQQQTAPIFPFEAEFTVDGVNGLRYGDVVTFHALPSRYKQNTCFSIIGITHNVSTQGDWTTTVKCIMRPNIEQNE